MPAKFRMPVAKSSKKDPQQYLLYRMERECFGGICRAQMTLAQIKTFAGAVCRNYGVPVVNFKFRDIGYWTGMCWNDGTIELNPKKRNSRTVVTIAHELAHHLHNHLAPEKLLEHQPHGPSYLACYMSLFDTARIIPLPGMRAIFASYKLQYVDPGDSSCITTLRQRLAKAPK